MHGEDERQFWVSKPKCLFRWRKFNMDDPEGFLGSWHDLHNGLKIHQSGNASAMFYGGFSRKLKTGFAFLLDNQNERNCCDV